MPNKRLTMAEKDLLFKEIVEEYQFDSKITIAELARKYQISYPVLYQYFKDKNLITQRRFIAKKSKGQKFTSEIVEKYCNDPTKSLKSLAEEYNVCVPTIKRWLLNEGVTTRFPKKISDTKIQEALDYYMDHPNSIIAAQNAGIGKHTFRNYLRENQLFKQKKVFQKDIAFDHDYFEVLNTEEKAYWFGFIYADGSVRKDQLTIELSKKDEEQLIKFKQSIL